VSVGGIVMAALLSSIITVVFSVIVVGEVVVVASSSSTRGIVSVSVVAGRVGSSSVQGIVASVIKWLRRAGASLPFIVGFDVIGKVIVASSSSLLMAIIGVGVVVIGRVGSASGLGVVLVVVIAQCAGELLHERE